MNIYGLNKTTLLDYPGKVAATIFLGGCNFRCPFCQNSSLLTPSHQQQTYSSEDILDFLRKRQHILDGVCISGGEPTLSPCLSDFLEKIKKLGYLIKLDTNGTNPQLLKELSQNGLIDKVAMDIKSSLSNYNKLSGLSKPDMCKWIPNIMESADYLIHGNLDYEFRTTVVKELHSAEDFVEIGNWLKDASSFFLQAYRDSEQVLLPGFSSYTRTELQYFSSILQKTIAQVSIRGID